MNFVPDQLNRLQWEDLERRAFHNRNERFLNVLRRARVPGGWLLHSYRELSCQTRRSPIEDQANPVALGIGEGSGLTFLPDPNHNWLLSSRAQDISSMNAFPDEVPVKRGLDLPKLTA